MIIFLSELQKDHLKLLHDHSLQVLVDFCKLCIDFLNNGVNTKKHSIAAEKLGVPLISVQNLIHALVYLLIEGSKHNLSDYDFKSSLALAGFTSDQQDVLLKLFNTKRVDLSEALNLLHQKDHMYQNFTWRLEIQVASRGCYEEIKPIVTMDFVLMIPKNFEPNTDNTASNVNENKIISPIHLSNAIHDAKAASHCQHIINHILLQCSLPNLVHLTNKLDQAVKESKSAHVRKIQRVLQL